MVRFYRRLIHRCDTAVYKNVIHVGNEWHWKSPSDDIEICRRLAELPVRDSSEVDWAALAKSWPPWSHHKLRSRWTTLEERHPFPIDDWKTLVNAVRQKIEAATLPKRSIHSQMSSEFIRDSDDD